MFDLPELARLWDALPPARVVGGAVRDGLAGRPLADIDLASPWPPDEVMETLRAAGIRTIPTGLAHGTVTALVGARSFEITTLRRDVATDGRHAQVEFTDDWREDAARRDFTINAMSASRDGTLHDYFGGQADLAVGRVRFVGAAAARIAEDYLRILRFFRFFARFGNGAPDEGAIAAIAELKAGVARLSAERVWSEIKLTLAAPDPRAAVRWMDTTGVLNLLLPGAAAARLEALVARGAPADALLRVAALLTEDAAGLAARLRLSLADRDELAALTSPNRLSPGLDNAALRRALADEPAKTLIARTWLAQDETPGWDDLRTSIAATAPPRFALHGRDLTALGFAPGRQLGEALAHTRAWWLAGGCIADKAACLAVARQCMMASK